MSRLRGLPEDIRSSILQYAPLNNARGVQNELDISLQRLVDEILLLDPTFDLASFLARLRNDTQRRVYLLSSPTMDLYNVLKQSNRWTVYKHRDNELQIDSDIDLTEQLENQFGNNYLQYNDLGTPGTSTGFLTLTWGDSDTIIQELKEIDTLSGYVPPSITTYTHL